MAEVAEVDMVANMEVDMVANMKVDMVANLKLVVVPVGSKSYVCPNFFHWLY